MGDILKELDANAKAPAWVKEAVKKFEGSANVDIPEWVDEEISKLRKAADDEQTQSRT